MINPFDKQLPKLPQGECADICLVLEGTYPLVSGGVSNWVEQLLSGLPHYRFALLFIGSAESDYQGLMYELPDNVCHIEFHFINDLQQSSRNQAGRLKKPKEQQLIKDLKAFLKSLSSALETDLPEMSLGSFAEENSGETPDDSVLESLENNLLHGSRVLAALQQSSAFWDLILEYYHQMYREQPFAHYLWCLHAICNPLPGLLSIAEHAPAARSYHTVSTGYAGLLAVFLHLLRKRPLLLTEHGIYTREREIDLCRAAWVPDEARVDDLDQSALTAMQGRMWNGFFKAISKLSYQAASVIVTLYANNQHLQRSYGAAERKCLIIPNGIELQRFKHLQRLQPAYIPRVLLLMGRVVRIKDIKTFIRTIYYLQPQLSNVEGWIAGPESEDPEYAHECKALVQHYGLQDQIRFLGFQKPENLLPKAGLLTLTSISEGQPLAILEGFAAGIPALSTDVGACRELIEGRDNQDKRLGHAGAVVPIANPELTAQAAFQLLTHTKRWHQAQQAAITRIQRYYNADRLINTYHSLYKKAVTYGRHWL